MMGSLGVIELLHGLYSSLLSIVCGHTYTSMSLLCTYAHIEYLLVLFPFWQAYLPVRFQVFLGELVSILSGYSILGLLGY
jgi:hypothetical protein